ncbi:MAG: NYN domain-containing protein [Actinomycetota bacterium]
MDAVVEGLEHRHLRSAIEFAVAIVAEAGKRRARLDHPAEVDRYLGVARIPNRALGPLRRAIEGDDQFRQRIGAGAVPELVDEIGRLWLQRPDGWQQRIEVAIGDQRVRAEADDLGAALKRAEKRRDAAEQAAIRARSEIVAATALTDELRAELVGHDEALSAAAAQIAELKAELREAKAAARHASDREAAATQRAEDAARTVDDLRAQAVGATSPALPVIDPASLDALAGNAEQVARRIGDLAAELRSSIAAETEVRNPPRRQPLALPGGVISTSAEAAEFLLRSGAAVFIDGYNVAKSGWPDRGLDDQRDYLIGRAEEIGMRFGTQSTIVFDGASVVGAHTAQRRSVRVVYSPAGTIADDVIRQLVAAIEPSRAVVVVTEDREVVDDVRAAGANVVSANAFLAIRR